MLKQEVYSERFVLDFCCGKRRNFNEVNVIRRKVDDFNLNVFKEHYLSSEDLFKLTQKEHVLPLESIKQYLLVELMIQILYYNGSALNQQKFNISRKDRWFR